MIRFLTLVFIASTMRMVVAQPIAPGTVILPISQSAVDLGNVVERAVIAKVLDIDSEPVLYILKFGSTQSIERTLNCSQLTRTVTVNGKKVDERIKLVTESFFKPKRNFTPTPQQPSTTVDNVTAFNLSGKCVPHDVWVQSLSTPKHVLLIREPLNESVKLDPFYSALLKEDTLLLFLEPDPPQGKKIQGQEGQEQEVPQYVFPPNQDWQNRRSTIRDA